MLIIILLKGGIGLAKVVAGNPRCDVMRDMDTDIMAEEVNPAVARDVNSVSMHSFYPYVELLSS